MSKFNLLAGDPYAPASAKTNKTKKGHSKVKKFNIKAERSRVIDEMNTSRILWHIVHRHRVALLILALVLSWVFYLIQLAPAISNIVTK